MVDDGSTDGTAEVARQAGAEVIVHEVNKGKGEALKTGYALGPGAGPRLGLHHGLATASICPRRCRASWTRADQRRAATSSWAPAWPRTENMPWIRKKTNQFTSWVISRLAGQDIPDSQNGYRLYRTACFDGLKLKTKRYDSESEILVRLARRGYRIGSAPITTVYGDEASSINPFVDTGRFFRLVFMLMFSRD